MSEWEIAASISDLFEVNEALQGFSEDPTGDNGICVVLAVLAAAQKAKIAAPVHDREADRQRFPDPDFNRWLDESVCDYHTVWEAVGDIQAAWTGWENRQYYAAQEPVAYVVDSDSGESVINHALPVGTGVYAQPAQAECAWRYDADDCAWETACGEYYVFNEGTPSDNKATFCHCCGKKIREMYLAE